MLWTHLINAAGCTCTFTLHAPTMEHTTLLYTFWCFWQAQWHQILNNPDQRVLGPKQATVGWSGTYILSTIELKVSSTLPQRVQLNYPPTIRLTSTNAKNSYVSSLTSNSSWPDSAESTCMVCEALMQPACYQWVLRLVRGYQITFGQCKSLHIFLWYCYWPPIQIRHAGFRWWSTLKTEIYNLLHLWQLTPTAQECQNVTIAEIQTFTMNAIANICWTKGYVHSGENSLRVCSSFISCQYILTDIHSKKHTSIITCFTPSSGSTGSASRESHDYIHTNFDHSFPLLPWLSLLPSCKLF